MIISFSKIERWVYFDVISFRSRENIFRPRDKEEKLTEKINLKEGK